MHIENEFETCIGISADNIYQPLVLFTETRTIQGYVLNIISHAYIFLFNYYLQLTLVKSLNLQDMLYLWKNKWSI